MEKQETMQGMEPAWEPAKQGLEELTEALAQSRKAKISGEVVSVRAQSKMTFATLRSGGSLAQAVGFGELASKLAALPAGSWAELSGTPKADPRAKGGIELQAEELREAAPCAPRPVLEGSAEELWLQYPSLRLRRPEVSLALRLRAALLSECRKWLESKGFWEICTPKIMGSPSESGAEVFEIGYFERKAYLAQSPQLFKQAAVGGGAGMYYEVGPVFRAERSFSARHATEFQGLDVELEGIRAPEELALIEASMIAHAIGQVLAGPLGAAAAQAFPGLGKVPRLAVVGWKQALEEAGEACELTGPGERRLGALYAERGIDLVAVLGMPWSKRPFYHMKGAGGESLSFEMIYRGTEITTGAVREHRPGVLLGQLAEKGLSGAGMEFYLESFAYGAPPHGGFGLGVERLVQLWLGLPSIRDVCFVARTPSRVDP